MSVSLPTEPAAGATRVRSPRVRALRALGLYVLLVVATVFCGTGEPGPLANVGGSAGIPVSIRLDTNAVNVPVAGTRRLLLSAVDGNGTAITNPSATWTSSNEAVATVGPDGTVRGVTTGVSDISVVVQGVEGAQLRASARVNVIAGSPPPPPPPPPPPGGGSTLPVHRITVTPDSFTLAQNATQVLRAAKFDSLGNRVLAGTVTWFVLNTDTGNVRLSATSGDSITVTAVRCCAARVIAGNSGRRDTAFILSAPQPVASVRVMAPFIGLPTGADVNVSYHVRVLDTQGNIVQRPVTYQVADGSVATVSPLGIARGLRAGTTTLTIRSGSVETTVPIRVKGNPNEPEGMDSISSRAFSGPVEDWDNVETRYPLMTFGTDPLAPRSPAGVTIFDYPAGFTGGGAPATAQKRIVPSTAYRQLYLSFWIQMGPTWQGHKTSVNKLFHLWVGGQNRGVVSASGAGAGPLVMQMNVQGGPDPRRVNFPLTMDRLALDAQFIRGKWHRAEVYLKLNTPGQSDGVLRWWLDSKLLGEYTDFVILRDGENFFWDQVQLSPTWGGGGDTVVVGHKLYMDHVYFSAGR